MSWPSHIECNCTSCKGLLCQITCFKSVKIFEFMREVFCIKNHNKKLNLIQKNAIPISFKF